MTRFFHIFLYLNIYTLLSVQVNSQELYLEIDAEIKVTQGLRDTLNLKSSYPDYRTIEKTVDTIPAILQRFGYLEAGINSIEKKNDSTFVADLFFGKKYKYLKVYYQPSDFSKKELSLVSKQITDSWFVLTFEETEIALTKLNAIKTESGNVFARIKLSDFNKEDPDIMSARLIMTSGEKRQIDSIAIKGYEKFPRSFLKYYAGVKKGKDFNSKKLNRQNELLNGLGFVSTLKGPEVLFREDKTTVFFYLEKRNNNLFDGILGFATDEETNKLQFNGYLNLELNNNLNYGEQLLVNYKADGNEQQNFRARARMPYLFRSPIGLELELRIFKRDSTFVTTEQNIKTSYQISPASSAFIGFKGVESSKLLDDVLAGSAVEDYTARYFTNGLQILKPQSDPLFPVKSLIEASSEIGYRELKEGRDDQIRINLTAASIFNLNYNNSVYLQNTTGILFSDTFLTNELFRFGGINSIRGFNENSIDAELFTVLNSEYRYRFSPGFYLHSIIDLGYFENSTAGLKQQLYSFGIGMGLLTKAGLLKFNLANGISEGQNFKFSNSKIHISLSSRF